jgi:hypothetical protein
MTPICFRRAFPWELPQRSTILSSLNFGDLHSTNFDLLSTGRDLSERPGVRAGEGVGEGDGVLVLRGGLGVTFMSGKAVRIPDKNIR